MAYGSGYSQGIGMNYNPLQNSPQGQGLPVSSQAGVSGGISGIGYTGPSQAQQQQGAAALGHEAQMGGLPSWAQDYIGTNEIQKSDPNFSYGKVQDFQRQSLQGYQGLQNKYGQEALQNPYWKQQGYKAEGFDPFQDSMINQYNYSWDPKQRSVTAQQQNVNAFTGQGIGGPTTNYNFKAPSRYRVSPTDPSKSYASASDDWLNDYHSKWNSYMDQVKQLGVNVGDTGYYYGGTKPGQPSSHQYQTSSSYVPFSAPQSKVSNYGYGY